MYERTHHFNKYIRVIVPDWLSHLIKKKSLDVPEDLNVILILKRFREGQSRHFGGGQSRDIFRGASEKNTLYEHV